MNEQKQQPRTQKTLDLFLADLRQELGDGRNGSEFLTLCISDDSELRIVHTSLLMHASHPFFRSED